MKNFEETTDILKEFYGDCLRFWERENAPDAHLNARKDVERITTDPYSPNGEKLNKNALNAFIKSLSK